MTIYTLDILLSQILTRICCAMSGSNYCFLTCMRVSQETGKVICSSNFLKNFPQFVVVHTVEGFCIVNEAEIDIFRKFPCFFYDPTNVGSLISGSSDFSKPSLYIWKFSVHVLLKPSLVNFEHYFTSMWNEHNCAVGLNILWHCPSLRLEWKLTFSSPVAPAEFSKFAGVLSAAL